MQLNRADFANLFKQTSPKLISSTALASLATAQQVVSLTGGQVDLTLPILGFRLVTRGRLVIGGADLASVKPEGFLNILRQIQIEGTNKRQGGNATLWNADLATIYGMQSMFQYRPNINITGGVIQGLPSTPFPAQAVVTQGTYDFRISVDLPAYPFAAPPGVRPGFLIRNEEWGDSLQINATSAVQLAGANEGFLGTGQVGTTITFSQFGAAGGNPVLEIYVLQAEMGLALKDQVVPGFLVRSAQPITALLQAAGNGINIFTLQKQPTTRIFTKVGVSTFAPAMSALSDTNVTALGVNLGGDRNIRNLLDIFVHKHDVAARRGRDPVQGYNCFDFLGSDNPDSAYPGDRVPEGSTFQLTANVAGVANALGIVIQEIMRYRPDGPLYSG